MSSPSEPARPVPASTAAGVVWDLSDLYHGVDDPQIEHDLAAALERAQGFERDYRGKVAHEAGPAADVLEAAVQELEAIAELMDKPLVYASLLHSAQTDDARHGALLARAQEQRTAINQHLIFFELEWAQVADDRAASVLAAPVLERYRHYLKQKRAWRPHLLSEPEEKVLDQKSVTGRAAFVRLFDESVSSIVFPFELAGVREDLSLSQILAKLHDADRVVRRAAADSLTRGLQANCRLLTFLFNNLVLDHRVDCDLRRFADPMAPRHLDNQISDAEVAALMTAAEVHFPVVQRYYRLKARLLGVEPLYDFDRYAPLFSDLPRCDWSQACRVVRESYAAFSPRAGEVIRQFFDRSWIDAELRAGKRGGAFCASTVTSAHPYILMNYTDKLRDVMTLAHELGHGLHQYLSRPVGYLQCHTPLTMAETASVFGEMLTFERLMKEYDEPRTRLALLCSKLEDSFSTVFRQVVLTRFEQAAHRARREQGELAPERIHQIWLDANRPMHGDVVQLTEGYGCWWMYIPHFIHTPFYCYAYAFGELLVLALVQKYRAEGLAFVRQYLEMLSSGGSDSPQRLLSRMGIDVTDPGFWSLGLQLLDGMVTEAESLAAKL